MGANRCGGEIVLWSRGHGWVLAGLVRVFEHLTDDHPDRDRSVRLYLEMTRRVAELQAEDGLWRSNLLDPGGSSDPEVSGSAFFCYALAWVLRHDLLRTDRMRPVVEAAWGGTRVRRARQRATEPSPAPGDRPAPVAQLEMAPYGVGAFLLAASEVFRLAQ